MLHRHKLTILYVKGLIQIQTEQISKVKTGHDAMIEKKQYRSTSNSAVKLL